MSELCEGSAKNTSTREEIYEAAHATLAALAAGKPELAHEIEVWLLTTKALWHRIGATNHLGSQGSVDPTSYFNDLDPVQKPKKPRPDN